MKWLDATINRADMSDSLRHSAGSIGTVSNLTRYADDIEMLLGATPEPALVSTDDSIEDPVAFAMEKHLEDFLVQNWSQTELGIDYDIFEDDGERVGQQYPTDTGPIEGRGMVVSVRKCDQNRAGSSPARTPSVDVISPILSEFLEHGQPSSSSAASSIAIPTRAPGLLSPSSTAHGHRTDTLETTRATPRDARPALRTSVTGICLTDKPNG